MTEAGAGSRAASCSAQAVRVLRSFREDADMQVLAATPGSLRPLATATCTKASTCSPPKHRTCTKCSSAARPPAGPTSPSTAPSSAPTGAERSTPDTGHGRWFSGKHRAHGGTVQIVSDPDGHPVAVSDVEPGSTHDLAAARATGFLGALHAAAALLGLPALADKGYDGAGAGVLTPTKGGNLHPGNLTRNLLLGCLRAEGERGIALLKTRWKALNRIRLCPQRIGAITKAALVLTRAERPIR